jgi:hypothetical protein
MHVYLTSKELLFGICIGPINDRFEVKERHFTQLYDDNGLPMGEQEFEFISPNQIRFISSGEVKNVDPQYKGSDIFCLFCFN